MFGDEWMRGMMTSLRSGRVWHLKQALVWYCCKKVAEMMMYGGMLATINGYNGYSCEYNGLCGFMKRI